MKKHAIFQVVFYAGALAVYYFSSPSVYESFKSQPVNTPTAKVQSPSKPIAIASADVETTMQTTSTIEASATVVNEQAQTSTTTIEVVATTTIPVEQIPPPPVI